MYEERRAPVKEGETYEVEIESVGEKGDGIAKVKGFVLFIGGTKKGEYVKVKITKVLKNVGFAQVVERLEKLEKPIKEKKRFATVRREELEAEALEPETVYEDTEDFGAELDKE